MNLCPMCRASESVDTIWPFCSAECLHADPSHSKSPVLRRMLAIFADRDSGAGGPGGMVPTSVAERLGWYLAGAFDARADYPELAELMAAARDVLRGGEHEGPCTNEDEHPAVRGACDLHWETAKARKERLRLALDQVTQPTQGDT